MTAAFLGRLLTKNMAIVLGSSAATVAAVETAEFSINRTVEEPIYLLAVPLLCKKNISEQRNSFAL